MNEGKKFEMKKMITIGLIVVLGVAGSAESQQNPAQWRKMLELSCSGTAGSGCGGGIGSRDGRDRNPARDVGMILQKGLFQQQYSLSSSIPRNNHDIRYNESDNQGIALQMLANNFRDLLRNSGLSGLMEELDWLADRSKRLVALGTTERVSTLSSERTAVSERGATLGFDPARMFSPTLSFNKKMKVVGDLQRHAVLVEIKWAF